MRRISEVLTVRSFKMKVSFSSGICNSIGHVSAVRQAKGIYHLSCKCDIPIEPWLMASFGSVVLENKSARVKFTGSV